MYKLYFLELQCSHYDHFTVFSNGYQEFEYDKMSFHKNNKREDEVGSSSPKENKRKYLRKNVCVIYICELCMYIHIQQYFYTHYHVFNNMNIIAGAYICVHVCFCIMYVSRNMDAMLCLYSTHVHYILFSETN